MTENERMCACCNAVKIDIFEYSRIKIWPEAGYSAIVVCDVCYIVIAEKAGFEPINSPHAKVIFNELTTKLGNINILNLIQEINGSASKKQTEFKCGCGKMNDVGVKKCWWCERIF